MTKTAVVTGSSSGIGYECARLLSGMGYKVYGFSRRGVCPENVIPVKCDIANEEDVKKAVSDIMKTEKSIDILINNAGMGISGPVEYSASENVERIINTNFKGAYFVTKEVLPVMRSKKSGSMVFVSSVAAEIAIPYQAFYSATKSALTSFALALRNEVSDYDIKVAVVEPGDARTGFTDARTKEFLPENVYENSKSAVNSMEKDERNGLLPCVVAKKIVKTSLSKYPKPVTVVGVKYKLFLFLFSLLPRRFSYYIVKKMY